MKILAIGEAKATHPKVNQSVNKKKKNSIMNDFLTVEQLINKLKSYPKDSLILVDGYEDGMDAILDIKNINVKYDDSRQWYYGPFEEVVDDSNIEVIKLVSTRGTRQ